MAMALFRFYEELNDFLPPEKRKTWFSYSFTGSPSVKDAIESLGVPHTEVDLIVANGGSVDFGYRICDNDRISVYPVFESLDISPVAVLRAKPLREPRFVLDVHLGKLAKYLRLLGFDTLYENDYSDEAIAGIASQDPGRIVLTMDRGLLKRKVITHGYCVRSRKWNEQVREVLARFDLYSQVKPFSLCLSCNGKIEHQADPPPGEIPPAVKRQCTEFSRCSRCGKLYWKGSHYDRMEALIGEFTARPES
ncbi:MAG: Mut7-C RNAse domain-containing protein [Candidatus Eremiobacteraeota bacterium]|nr:Mut7-C RNAse domain-containing protein [Candidatus Eremiobacteraeota bacterium]